MKKIFVFVSAVILGLSLAQNNNGFMVIRTPGIANQLRTTENNTRAATLTVRCIGANAEVILDPRITLDQSQAPLVQTQTGALRWDFVPESGELILPASATKEFIENLALIRELRMNLPEVTNPNWRVVFNTTGFVNGFRQLPCSTAIRLVQVNPSAPVVATNVLSPTIAFIAPIEFTRAFGGRFEPSNNKLIWEYNGVQLLLEVNKKNVLNVLNNSSFELPTAVQILKNGRTVVPARILSNFNCSIPQTKPSDATILVRCGAGATLMERELPRY